ncbi:glycosyltransferase family 2 protein [Tenggerimyces flavus]|uniref:4,4'-diaponeurosporenoate glycosyltransferase n=1 Tax=Tenggerimyces flavus TaxID=1708749 RepID=A0ABV7YKS7_9ACTN|nr:glycosyltransferase [Tenggerimyces flavus]MBM7789575.1 hypothetical protein [Tenggerimyces flavus]
MATPSVRTVPVAAVVPARDSASVWRAVSAIQAGTLTPAEIVVVDDGSRQPVDAIESATILRTGGIGRAGARNLGARSTTAPLLWFVDSDVVVEPDTLSLLHIELAKGMDGVMGVYSESRRSGYEEFRLTHQRFHVAAHQEPRHVSAACLLVRRTCFDRIGGFPHLPAMEDVAFGLAGTKLGYRWRSVLAATVEHLPRPGAFALLRRDHRERGGSAVELLAGHGPVLEHAAAPRELVAAAASLVALACPFLPRRLGGRAPIRLVALAAWFAADWPWLGYAVRRKGWRFAVRSVFWLVLFRTAVASGAVRAGLRRLRRST